MQRLLAHGAEILGQFGSEKYHGLAQHKSVFSAAERQHVYPRVAGQSAHIHAAGFQGGHGVGQTSSVHVHQQPVGMGFVRQGAHFLGRVDGALFRGLSDGQQMRGAVVTIFEVGQIRVQGLGGNFTVHRRHGQQFGAHAPLGRAALVGVDMGHIGADDALPGAQGAAQRQHIAPCAA